MDDHALPRHSTASPRARSAFYSKLALAYMLLLAYGSLFPFDQWDAMRGGLSSLLSPLWPNHLSRSDVVTNLVVYVPFGLFMALAWTRPTRTRAKILIITLCGLALSLCMEYLQTYLPARVSSLSDTLLNTFGTFGGAVLGHNFAAHTFTGTRMRRLRQRFFVEGAWADLGLIVAGLWVLSQWVPLIPSLDRGTLVEGIRPILRVLRGEAEFGLVRACTYGLDILALGLLAATLVRPNQRLLALFGGFIAVVLLLKIPIVGRQLSLEAMAGASAALIALPLLLHAPPRTRAITAGALLLISYAIEQLRRGDEPGATLHAMNWMPFGGQMASLGGFEDIVAGLWPFAALAYFTLLTRPRYPRVIRLAGVLLVAAFTFALETMQTHIVGRYPDITDVCLAVLGWWLPWRVPYAQEAQAGPTPQPAVARASASGRTLRIVIAMSVAAVALAAATQFFNAPERALDEKKLPQLPAPETLAPVSLPDFHRAHPRLPAPSAADIALLRGANPDYLAQIARRAANPDDAYATALAAFIEPGSQDLARLHRHLMALQFTWRGHDQTQPIAVAYDWLYDQWSDTQRTALRAKLAEACEYQIGYIRRERLSPYNVYLYNSPFQALMACAIALYGDDPRGDPVMAFTHDYWKNRVLPVWRQIMGRRGGWHEGGEYVGIGIGQAIYRLPAMWRKATGEDVFKTEPGIRGFLDFLVYRTRPDGTHMRLGDTAFFDRDSTDRAALALEFRHKAAYSLRRPPRPPTPTSWPWGPLTDDTLYDPNASAALPRSAYFDGLGLVVMRNGWGPDATYITFKAGDNYWSHSHLDQGGFTIYKGGALALDSGYYGPEYGADHHMNYAYQTIAHNALTVTDPGDTVPIPARGKKPARPIANDGGQRRVGSGWGIEPAPVDLAEWQQKRDIYHTGRIEHLLRRDGLTVVSADLTAAYTNALSGKGTFSHRTRRVEHAHRLFGYDEIDDVIVIRDRVTATDADFRKRWLLHSSEKPEITPNGFIVRALPTPDPGHAGGRLDAHVLLPEQRYIQPLGGRGFEFFVDGKNYDEGITDKMRARRVAEPGAWRVELMPDAPRKQDDFLVVLLPSLGDRPPPHQVRRLTSAGGVGVEIAGPRRTTRWWFTDTKGHARVEVIENGGLKRHDLRPGA